MFSTSTRSRKGTVFGWGAGAILAASFVLLEVAAIRENLEARSWSRIDAKVTSSSPEQDCGKGGTLYSPLVRYQYFFKGKRYVNDVIAYSHFDCGGYEEMKVRTDQFTVGQTVQARVNPNDPTQAVLIAGEVNLESKLGLAFFVSMFLGCAYFAGKAWHGADSHANR